MKQLATKPEKPTAEACLPQHRSTTRLIVDDSAGQTGSGTSPKRSAPRDGSCARESPAIREGQSCGWGEGERRPNRNQTTIVHPNRTTYIRVYWLTSCK
eukprot:6191526-Pleurochrysis_carterae.AAC.1